MTRTAHAAALALSLVMTLVIFSGVAQLSSLSHDGATLSQAQTSMATPRS